MEENRDKFFFVQPWIREVLMAVKKELKSEYLPANRAFYQTHFGNRPLHRLMQEEIFFVFERELEKGNVELAEWVISRWVFKHGDVYQHFAGRLSEIQEDFTQIASLTEEQSERILEGAVESFGPISTYLFAYVNGVVFPKSILERLRKDAEVAREQEQKRDEALEEARTMETLVQKHEREMKRVMDKYESKLAGLEKKYIVDTGALKKQISSLQKQLSN